MGWTHRATAMSDLNWTTKKPTKPGWYFWRKPAVSSYPTMVLVMFTPDQRSLYTVFHEGSPEKDSQSAQFVESVEWAGPLKPPE
jgi:hypothetical protein